MYQGIKSKQRTKITQLSHYCTKVAISIFCTEKSQSNLPKYHQSQNNILYFGYVQRKLLGGNKEDMVIVNNLT
uniref:Putative ovule protein n=1 Tax=Solanum chacoense TaxID=4108 RepID=A0A0V0GT44_SOLCH